MDLRSRLDDLSPVKRELFERLRNTEKLGEPVALSLENRCPTSFQQKHLWLLEKDYPGFLAHNVPCSLQLKGPLDVSALESSLSLVVRRHAVLRASITDDGDWQHFMPPARVQLPLNELDIDHDDNIDKALERRLYDFSREPFDLKKGPLYRFLLRRIDKDQHLFSCCFHHTVFDGSSISVLYRELEAAYPAFKQGRTPQLPALDSQYADYVLWQRSRVKSPAYKESLSYWRQRLQGRPPCLQLTGDNPRPPKFNQEGARVSVDIEPKLMDALTGLAGENNCTLFVVLLAAYAMLLHYYSGEQDIVIGSPTAGRLRSDYEALIGCFVNILPLRFDFREDLSFGRLLRRAQQVVVEALSHQGVSWEELMGDESLQGNSDGNPLFNIFLAYRNIPEEELRLPGVKATWDRLDNGTARFDLSLFITRLPSRTYGQLEFRKELIDFETAQRIVNDLTVLLKDIVSNPDSTVDQLRKRCL